MTLNCWEFMKCGREPGGRRVGELGVCRAAEFGASDGFLGGTNGGKACCFITGTFCEEILQGTYRDKSKNCWDCAFYRALRQKHGAAFSMPAFAEYLSKHDPAACDEFIRDNDPDPPAGG
jgi:hypothetical protein